MDTGYPMLCCSLVATSDFDCLTLIELIIERTEMKLEIYLSEFMDINLKTEPLSGTQVCKC